MKERNEYHISEDSMQSIIFEEGSERLTVTRSVDADDSAVGWSSEFDLTSTIKTAEQYLGAIDAEAIGYLSVAENGEKAFGEVLGKDIAEYIAKCPECVRFAHIPFSDFALIWKYSHLDLSGDTTEFMKIGAISNRKFSKGALDSLIVATASPRIRNFVLQSPDALNESND